MTQHDVLRYIENAEQPVTTKQIQEHFDVHPNNIQRNLRKLEQAGFIRVERESRKGGFIKKLFWAKD